MARFSDMPEEVLEEIMSWLPPESLKRFKCVCKSWYFYINDLMNNPTFVAKHLCNTKKKLLSHPFLHFRKLWTSRCPEVPEDSLEGNYFLTFASSDSCSVDDHIPCVIEDLKFLNSSCFDMLSRLVSCNGIICCYHRDYRIMKDIIFLLNPALRELKIVPDADFGDGCEIYGVGFGYDSRSNDYKVVTIKSADQDDPYPYKAEVYSLSTNSWKEIELNVDIFFFSMFEYQVVYCNGVCYWYYFNMGCNILSFNFSDEVFGSIAIPDQVPRLIEPDEPLEKLSKITVWNESITLFFYLELDPFLVDMWVMDACSSGVEGSCSWTKHLTIGPLVGINEPVLFWGNEVLFMENKDLEIVSYDLPANELDDRSICMEQFSNRVVICEKSLVSVLKEKNRKAQKMQFASMSMGWVNETKKAKHDELVTDEETVKGVVGSGCGHMKEVGLMIKKSVDPSTSSSSTPTYPPQQQSSPLDMQQKMNEMFNDQMQMVTALRRHFPGIDIPMPQASQMLSPPSNPIDIQQWINQMFNYNTQLVTVLRRLFPGVDIPMLSRP